MTPERQKLLSALVDMSRGLSVLRGFDDALATLVAGARTIFGSDMAFVSVNDEPSKTTRIRETLGVTTDACRDLSMRYGEGFLGRVVAAEGPLHTIDCLEDPRLTSAPGIRARVRDEGVRAILGAPLLANGRRIGGLFIADRTAHGFSPDAVSVLESLASQGAVVLANALTAGEMVRSSDEARAAQEDATGRLGEALRIREAEEHFLGALAGIPDPAVFELTVRKVIREEAYVLILDPDRGIIDQAPLPAPVAGLDALLHIDGSAETISSLSDRLRLAPAFVGGRLLGAVALYGPVTVTDEYLLGRAAAALGVLLAFRQTLTNTAAREHSELLSRLVGGVPLSGRGVARHELDRTGLRSDEPLAIAVVSPVVDPPSVILRALRTVLKGPMLSSVHGGHVCLLVNADDIDVFAQRCARDLAGRGLNSTVAVESIGLLGKPDLFEAVPQAHVLAERVTRVATSLGRTGEAVTRGALGAVALVIADDDSLSRDLARHAIAPLVDYDAEHGTELVTTAAAVLDASQRITIAASVLHVHENTVRQRITRIDHLLGPGWREGGSSLDVHLALRLHQLTRSRRHTI